MSNIYTVQKDAFIEANRLRAEGKNALVFKLSNDKFQVVVLEPPKPKK